ncbi:MAG: class I SAM-dependent methyltransferase [Bryobacterales bacterium]
MFVHAPEQQVEDFERWPVPQDYLDSPEVAYRNLQAIELARGSAEELVGNYLWMAEADCERLLAQAQRHLGFRFQGQGIELGAGCAMLSALVARSPEVRSVYALEICEEMVRRGVPKVARHVLGSDAHKVKGVFGSFNDLQLPDNSLDFALEIDSIHHSHDLNLTLREAARVLKPGAQLLCFDRCHPNSLTDEEVDEMLSQVYSDEFMRKSHYPPGVKMTRRENGEHEYREREWMAAFQQAGFRVVGAKCFWREVRTARALKGLLQVLPAAIRRRLYRSDNGSFQTTLDWVRQRYQALTCQTHFGRPILSTREATGVFLVEKG